MQFELVSIFLAFIGSVIWLVRLESKVHSSRDEVGELRKLCKSLQEEHEKDLSRLKEEKDRELVRLKNESDRELDQVRQQFEAGHAAIWQEFKSIQSHLSTIVLALGRVEGRLDSKKD